MVIPPALYHESSLAEDLREAIVRIFAAATTAADAVVVVTVNRSYKLYWPLLFLFILIISSLVCSLNVESSVHMQRQSRLSGRLFDGGSGDRKGC